MKIANIRYQDCAVGRVYRAHAGFQARGRIICLLADRQFGELVTVREVVRELARLGYQFGGRVGSYTTTFEED